MDPAPGKCDIRIFPVQLPVSGIAVTDNYPCKALQEFSRVVCFPGLLVFIQDNGGYPHIPFPSGRPTCNSYCLPGAHLSIL